MRFQAGIATVVAGLLLVRKTSTLPVGAEQQPIFLPEEEFSDPVSYAPSPLRSTIRDVLLQHEVIGDVLDDFEPLYYLDIKYPKHHESVLLGNDIPVDSVSGRPVFTFHSIDTSYAPLRRRSRKSQPLMPPGAAKKSAFTLILTDPDAKSRDNPSEWSSSKFLRRANSSNIPQNGLKCAIG